jgi:hypothetical protein
MGFEIAKIVEALISIHTGLWPEMGIFAKNYQFIWPTIKR